MRDGEQRPELNLAEPIAIVLTLGQWNTTLQMIAKAPWDIADPLMSSIRLQVARTLQRAEQQQPQQEARPIPEPPPPQEETAFRRG